MYFVLIWQHRELLSDDLKVEAENSRGGESKIAHLSFLTSAYKTRYYWFEVLECLRRLSLAIFIGFAPRESAAAPSLGILISTAFIWVTTELRPYKDTADNTLAIILAYALMLLFLAALLIKVEATDDDFVHQEDFFTVLLFLFLFSGPLSLLVNPTTDMLRRWKKEHQEVSVDGEESHDEEAADGEMANDATMASATGADFTPRNKKRRPPPPRRAERFCDDDSSENKTHARKAHRIFSMVGRSIGGSPGGNDVGIISKGVGQSADVIRSAGGTGSDDVKPESTGEERNHTRTGEKSYAEKEAKVVLERAQKTEIEALKKAKAILDEAGAILDKEKAHAEMEAEAILQKAEIYAGIKAKAILDNAKAILDKQKADAVKEAKAIREKAAGILDKSKAYAEKEFKTIRDEITSRAIKQAYEQAKAIRERAERDAMKDAKAIRERAEKEAKAILKKATKAEMAVQRGMKAQAAEKGNMESASLSTIDEEKAADGNEGMKAQAAEKGNMESASLSTADGNEGESAALDLLTPSHSSTHMTPRYSNSTTPSTPTSRTSNTPIRNAHRMMQRGMVI